MALLDDLKSVVSGIPAELKEKKGIYSFETIIAERKAFLSRKKLTYSAKFRIDEQEREVVFTEMLKESGFGLSSGSDDLSPGFSSKKYTYNTLSGAREGTIQEQSNLFGKKYSYTFDFAAIRKQIQAAAEKNGYAFTYKIMGV